MKILFSMNWLKFNMGNSHGTLVNYIMFSNTLQNIGATILLIRFGSVYVLYHMGQY